MLLGNINIGEGYGEHKLSHMYIAIAVQYVKQRKQRHVILSCILYVN